MTLTVSLGVASYCYGEPDRQVAILESLVKQGLTKLVREVVVDEALPKTKRWKAARVVEVAPKKTTWLTATKAAPIIAAVSKASYDSYSWDELGGFTDIQPIALVNDGKEKPASYKQYTLYDDVEVRVLDLAASEKNWAKTSIAYKLHQLAKKHRLVVHSG